MPCARAITAKTLGIFFCFVFCLVTEGGLRAEGQLPQGMDFRYVFKTLVFGTFQDPSSSTQNPNNDFLQIPTYVLEGEIRPDFYLDYDRLNFVLKPRLNGSWEHWEEGSLEGETDTESDLFVNEWLASLRLFEGFFVSYGRENLQWGPSYFISPSNPFFRDNGLSNPKREVPGSDFARLVWVPTSDWTLSLIANVDEGRQDFPKGFERTYAVKLDYTTFRKYFSFITSFRESNEANDIERTQFGGYAGWSVSDALLVYGEGSGSLRSDALYPVRDQRAPFGIGMSPVKSEEDSFSGTVLVGGGYTLQSGPTFVMEYVYNGAGYDDSEADLYFKLRQRASNSFFSMDPLSGLSRLTLSQTLDPGLRLLRRNYVLLQYQQAQIRNVLSLVFRYTQNIDDQSSQFIPFVQYDIGDRTQVFLIGVQNFGSGDTEFGSLVDYSYTIGFEFTF